MISLAIVIVIGIALITYRVLRHRHQTNHLIKTMRRCKVPLTVDQLQAKARRRSIDKARVLRFRDWAKNHNMLSCTEQPRPGGGVDLYYQLKPSPQANEGQ